MSMTEIITIKRKPIEYYNIDINATKYGMLCNLDGQYPRYTIFAPNDNITINVNIPEEKYKMLATFINNTNYVNNITQDLRNVRSSKDISMCLIKDIFTIFNTPTSFLKPTNQYSVIMKGKIILDKINYKSGMYHTISYKNPQTGEEIFKKYMTFRKHILMLLLCCCGSYIVSNILLNSSKFVKSSNIFSFLSSILFATVVHMYIRNYYSASPNKIIKVMHKYFKKFFSTIQYFYKKMY